MHKAVPSPHQGGRRVGLRAEPALRSLRRARRDRRLAGQPWSEAAYRAYVTALAAAFATYTAIGLVGDAPLDAATVERLHLDGAAWAGLLAALLVLAAVRSGCRGGPLAVEAADVHHVLLSPHDRTAALARPATRAFAAAVALGGLLGGLVGALVERRLPPAGQAVAWWLSMGALGATYGLLAVAAALVTAARLGPSWLWRGAAWALVALAAADVLGAPVSAPTTALGRIGFWPYRPPGAAAVVAVAGVVVLSVVGRSTIGGLSIEAARRRSRLLGQMRFAVTRQDVRTAVVLHRQLSAERHRTRPWFRVPSGRLGDRLPVVARDLHSVARWPLVRAGRLVVLAAVWGAATAGTWAGTSPLAFVAGLALFVAALDAVEPLAQELDHPARLHSLPVDAGWVLVRHLAVPVAVVALAAAVGTGAALALRPDRLLAGVLAVSALPAAGAAVAGAAVSVVSEPTLDPAAEALLPPEAAGPRLVLRMAWPPAIAVFGQYPLFAASRVAVDGLDPVAEAMTAAVPVVVLAGLVAAWVRYRAVVHRALGDLGAGS